MIDLNKAALLLPTNGNPESMPALDYGLDLAALMDIPVTLMGIAERPREESTVTEVIAHYNMQAEEHGLDCKVVQLSGVAEEAIRDYCQSHHKLTVLGPLGRGALRRWVRGRSYRHMEESISGPILYTNQPFKKLARILVCVGGLGYATNTVKLAAWLAQRAASQMTLLHVIEPNTFEYHTTEELSDHAENILGSDTPQARTLQADLEMIRASGVVVNLIVRNGYPVNEILEEAAKGYDLIGMGSHFSTHSLRHHFTPNVTAEVAETLKCPVLSMHAEFEVIWDFQSV